MSSTRVMSRVVDAIGLALVAMLLWRVFFTTRTSFSELAASIGLAGLAVALFERRSLRTVVDAPLAAYLVFSLLSAALHYGRYPAFAGLVAVAPWHPGAHLVAVVAYFYGVAFLLNTQRRVSALVGGLAIAASAIGLVAIYDHAQYGFDARIWEYPLLPQWLGYPQVGLILSVGFPLLTAAAMAGSSAATVAGAAVAAIVTAGMVTTLYSRAAMVTVAVTYAALCGVEFARFKTYRLTTAALVLGVMTLIGAVTLHRTQWISSFWVNPQYGFDTSTSVNTRMAVWERTAAMIRDHPLMGVGPGNYTVVLEKDYYISQQLRENGHAHNMMLHLAAEQGLPAAIAFLLVWCRLAWLLLRSTGRSHRGLLAAGCLGALIAFFTRSLTDTFLSSTGSPSERTAFVMWTLLAAAAAVGRLPAREVASE